MTTRAEHIAWCKARALELVDAGDPKLAFASMVSDLNKHPETVGNQAIRLGMLLIIQGDLDTPEAMRDYIEGFA